MGRVRQPIFAQAVKRPREGMAACRDGIAPKTLAFWL